MCIYTRTCSNIYYRYYWSLNIVIFHVKRSWESVFWKKVVKFYVLGQKIIETNVTNTKGWVDWFFSWTYFSLQFVAIWRQHFGHRKYEIKHLIHPGFKKWWEILPWNFLKIFEPIFERFCQKLLAWKIVSSNY